MGLNIEKKFLILLTGLVLMLSCNKNNFLDKKPSSDLVIPSTLEDLQALLDNNLVMQETPILGELSADNFYMTDSVWQSRDVKERNAYIWAKDIYQGQGNVEDWNIPYEQVFYANVVLDGLAKIAITSINTTKWHLLQGSAFFIRAYAFYNLAQVFAQLYDVSTAANDSGIVLRLNSDPTQPSIRANVQQTYKQIISDLQHASILLSVITVPNPARPSKAAALAMLARVYLSMRDTGNAGLYADSCLSIDNSLIDYNAVRSNPSSLFSESNSETLYQSHMLSSSQVLGGLVYFLYPARVDSELYNSYADSDLRKTILFTSSNGFPTLRYSYSGSLYPFSGLATDEIYLIRAECYARAGNTGPALADLNTLLQNRWVSGSFLAYTSGNLPGTLLNTILAERRKELPFRGLRWTDLRRLNADGANITLTRVINGMSIQLRPNDQRYVLPIPPDVLKLSGIK